MSANDSNQCSRSGNGSFHTISTLRLLVRNSIPRSTTLPSTLMPKTRLRRLTDSNNTSEQSTKASKLYEPYLGKSGIQGLVRHTYPLITLKNILYSPPQEMSNMQRLLSYGILSLITSTPIAGGPTPGLGTNEEEEQSGRTRQGVMNDEGAWCWREECESSSILICRFYIIPD